MNGDDEQEYGLWIAQGEWRSRGGGPPFLPTLLTVQYIHIKFSIAVFGLVNPSFQVLGCDFLFLTRL